MGAGVRKQQLETENVKLLLDVGEQRGRRSAASLPAGPKDLGRGRLPPYDVRGGLGPARTEDVGGAGEATFPLACALIDHRPQKAVERGEHPDRADGVPVRLRHEGGPK